MYSRTIQQLESQQVRHDTLEKLRKGTICSGTGNSSEQTAAVQLF